MGARARARLPASLDSLEGFRAVVSGFAREHGMDAAAVSAIELALEEALVNIASYAYPGGGGEAEVLCEFDRDRLVLEIMDWGVPFDASTARAPECEADIEKRQIGGLGLYLISQVMDEVRYRREDDCNHLILVKTKTPRPDPSKE